MKELIFPFVDVSNFIDKTAPSFEEISLSLKNKSVKLQNGGLSLAKDNHGCESTTNVAIIVPYRDRLVNLKGFLNNMHPFLTRQQINYRIYLIEPVQNVTFNRGLLSNIGFLSSLNDMKYNCFFFHDVDLIPEYENLMYNCNQNSPVQFAVSHTIFNLT